MRFKQYLNENTNSFSSLEEFNETINRECKPYISLLKGKEPLARGMNPGVQDITEWIGMKNVRKNRVPRGMPQKDFEMFNKWLDKHGHNRRDKSVVCTSNQKWASSFSSKVYYIFPIGKFSYSWIRAKDVNLDDNTTGWDPDMIDELTSSFMSKLSRSMRFDFNRKGTYEYLRKYIFTNEGFNDAYNQGYEFWINCDMYYYIKADSDLVWNGKEFSSSTGEFNEFMKLYKGWNG